MPGIAGIYTPDPNSKPETTLNRMLSSMTHRDDCLQSRSLHADPGFAFGRSSLAVFKQNSEFIRSVDQSLELILDGELYTDQGARPGSQDLLAILRDDRTGALNDLRGEFSGAFYDSVNRQLVLLSDKFGLRPLYYTPFPGGFAFATEVKALLGIPEVSREFNQRAFADLYYFGFVLGQKTLFNEIHLLPPASCLRYDFRRQTWKVTPYWQVESLFSSVDSQEERVPEQDLADYFLMSVARRFHADEAIGISLSGGLDSRLILAALGERAQRLPSYTLGLPGCRDQKLTERMAQLVGTSHKFLALQAQDLGDFRALAETLVSLSDGFYHPHESTEKKALDYFSEAPFRIVLRGHAGELAKASLAYPLQATSDLLACRSREQVFDCILKKANLGIQEIQPEDLFLPALADLVSEGPAASLRETFHSLDRPLANADMCLYAYATEWVRRQVVASLSVFKAHTEVRLPFMDEDFLRIMLKLPLAERFSGETHRTLIKRFSPRMALIPDSNTGAPLTAGKTRLFVSDKINSILKRVSLPGFRHYTEFEDWQRNQFRTSLEEILFDPKTLERGIYQPDTLRRVFQEHVQGKRSCAKLLGTIAGLELYMRQCES